MRSCARLEWEGFKRRPALSPPLDGKLLDLSCLLIHRNETCCSNEHSYRVACVVGKKNVYCIDDILPKKAKKISKKMYFSL